MKNLLLITLGAVILLTLLTTFNEFVLSRVITFFLVGYGLGEIINKINDYDN